MSHVIIDDKHIFGYLKFDLIENHFPNSDKIVFWNSFKVLYNVSLKFNSIALYLVSTCWYSFFSIATSELCSSSFYIVIVSLHSIDRLSLLIVSLAFFLFPSNFEKSLGSGSPNNTINLFLLLFGMMTLASTGSFLASIWKSLYFLNIEA